MDGHLPGPGRFTSLDDDMARARELKRHRQFHQRVQSCYQRHLSSPSLKEALIHDLARLLSSFAPN